MSCLLLEGFDDYGPIGITGANIATNFSSYYATNGGDLAIVAGLSSTGNALVIFSGEYLLRTFPLSYNRLIGGFRFLVGPGSNDAIFAFNVNTTIECCIQLDTGAIPAFYNGNRSTLLGTFSTSPLIGNAIHYLEYDITFGSSGGIYQFWMDGISVLSGSGANVSPSSTINTAGFYSTGGSNSITVDDWYIFSSAGSTNNAVLLTNPRIETQFPISDSSIQFTPIASILGVSYNAGGFTSGPGANQVMLRKYTAQANGTLSSISWSPSNSNTTVKAKGLFYIDSGGPSGSPTVGAEVVGTGGGVTQTSTFGSPPSITAGTSYWIGLMTDTGLNYYLSDGNTNGYAVSNTYTSGAPNSPAVVGGHSDWIIWGNVTSYTGNWSSQNQNPTNLISYVSDATVNDQDFYHFPNLSTSPSFIYAVGVKENAALNGGGSRTINANINSGGTINGGNTTGITVQSVTNWYDTYFDVDPHTSTTWTLSGVNNITAGPQIAS